MSFIHSKTYQLADRLYMLCEYDDVSLKPAWGVLSDIPSFQDAYSVLNSEQATAVCYTVCKQLQCAIQ